MGRLLVGGGGGQRVCSPLSNYWGGGGLAPPGPRSSYTYDKYFIAVYKMSSIIKFFFLINFQTQDTNTNIFVHYPYLR